MKMRSAKFILLTIAACVVSGVALWAQAPSSQTDSANPNWTSTTDSRNGDADPIRTVESHSQSGNRSIDKQTVERRGDDGGFAPYQDIEKETVQVDADTVRTTTRTFTRNPDGAKQLVEVVEEEKHSAGTDSTVVRSTSDPDVNGNLQVIRRQTEQTTKTSPNVEEIKTTVQLPDLNGGLAAAVKVEEHRERSSDGGANGAVESKKTTLLPDGAGNWQVGEIRRTTIAQDGDHRTTDERVFLPDSEGKIGEISHTITNATESASGEKLDTVETYSTSIPGAVPDGRLHLVERDITAQQTSATGQQVTQQRVEQANPGDPASGLQVVTVTIDTVRPGDSGAQATRTIQARDANGSLPVISVDTTKSDNLHAIQVQIAPSPSDAPKKEAK
jgi:hypothetical protein